VCVQEQASARRNELYPLGFFGLLFVNTLFNQWVVFSHSSGSGTGALLLAGFVLQGLANPAIGHGSDWVRRRFGSRRLVFVLSAPALLLVDAGLWWPGAPTVLAPIYCLVYATVTQPYLALLPAMASDQKTRLRFTLVGAFFALLAAAAALLVGPWAIARFGFEGLATIGCSVLVAALIVPLLIVKEAPLDGAVKHAASGVVAQLREMLSEPGVARFVGTNLLLSATMMTLVVSSPFVAGALLGAGHEVTQWLNGALVAGMLLSVALLGVAGKRVEASILFRLGAIVGAVVLAALESSSVLGGAPMGLWLVGFGLLGYLALSTMALPSLIVAQLATQDGKGREGLFFSLNGGAVAFGNALGAFFASSLLGLSSSTSDPRGVQLAVATALVTAAAASALMPWRIPRPVPAAP
jgi:Na+/melibiose symporter-like transporter